MKGFYSLAQRSFFCIANGRLEAKAIYHQHSWWVLKGGCENAPPFLFYKKTVSLLKNQQFLGFGAEKGI